MDKDKIEFVKLEKHLTKDVRDQHVNGELIVIWRDWDKIIQTDPKMVYISSVNPGEIKGPHLHTLRDSYFVCISGTVVFIIKDMMGNYHEIESNSDNPIMIQVPRKYSSAHINTGDKPASILVLASVAWKPNDGEMLNVSFDDYDWKKFDK